MNRSFNAKQRRAFNDFHGRIDLLADELEWELRFASDDLPRANKVREWAKQLKDEIQSIPWMFN